MPPRAPWICLRPRHTRPGNGFLETAASFKGTRLQDRMPLPSILLCLFGPLFRLEGAFPANRCPCPRNRAPLIPESGTLRPEKGCPLASNHLIIKDQLSRKDLKGNHRPLNGSPDWTRKYQGFAAKRGDKRELSASMSQALAKYLQLQNIVGNVTCPLAKIPCPPIST